MNDLASEFFYEGIRRIIPGLVIIVLFMRKEAEEVFHEHLDIFSPYLFGACILGFAWLIGLLVETITSANGPVGWFLRPLLLRLKFPWCKGCMSFVLGEKTMGEMSPTIVHKKGISKELARESRRQYYYFGATIIMCRCLCPIFFLSIFYQPEPFTNHHWHIQHFECGGFIACFLAWFVLRLERKQI
jgi:hypothetical protein